MGDHDDSDKKKKKKKKDKKKKDKKLRDKVKDLVKKDVEKEVEKWPIIGGNTWLPPKPKPYYKPDLIYHPEPEMTVCPPPPMRPGCVFPIEELQRPEAIECGPELVACVEDYKEDETVIMGGPASKFDGVGSGLPPGAAPRLLSTSSSDEDSAHMSMVQMRGQERENEEEEVDDETDRRRNKMGNKNYRKTKDLVKKMMDKQREKKNNIKKEVHKDLKKEFTKDLPRPRPYSTRPFMTKDLPRPMPLPYQFKPVEMTVCPPPPMRPGCVFPIEELQRPEAIECGPELVACVEDYREDETVIMGGPASKFDGVGSGLPPGAAPRLLSTSSSDEDSEHMSMV